MLIVDAHLDLAWNALQWNRDLTQSASAIREAEVGMSGPGRAQNTVALPELRMARVALCFATLLARSTGAPVEHIDFPTPEQAYGVAHGQLAYYRALEVSGQIRIIADVTQLDRHMAEWVRWDDGASGDSPPVGVIISMESADPILAPADAGDWRDGGVRIIGPAHYGSGRYAGGTSSEAGMTPLGLALLDEMEKQSIILDLTHLSDRAFWQALERFSGPVIASHNNCRALVPHQRQLDDRQLAAIVGREGVIGVALDTWMLLPGWVRGVTTNESVSLRAVVDHIDHICQLASSSEYVGIGSDLDGGFGREQSPHDLDTIADLQQFVALLDARGYSAADIDGIMHGNWLRLLRRVWR